MIGEVVETLARLDKAFADLRFDEMADAIYHFTWGTFCDWYVELVKGAFDDETKRVAAWAFDQILVMLHPFMPFVTEELWHAMGERPYDLIVANWPEPEAQRDPQATRDVGGLVEVIEQVRALRAELNIPWSATLVPHVIGGDAEAMDRLSKNSATLARMAKVGAPIAADPVPSSSAQIHTGGATIAFPLEGVIDLDAEKARLSKGVAAAEKERDSLAARLANPSFTERAKPEAVEKARADHDSKSAEADRLRAALDRLG
jgi:valyl-tRNA synthetase